MMFIPRGKSLVFFVHLEITKKSHKSLKIAEKSHEKITKSTKITKNHRKKSCYSKITKITYAIFRSDVPLGLFLTFL